MDRSSAASTLNPSTVEPAATGTFRRTEQRDSLSKQLWDCDLASGLPRKIANTGTQAFPGELARIRSFLEEQFPSLTEETLGSTPSAWLRSVKRNYLAACDLLELRYEQQTIGVLVGAPEDWSTYYVRIFAVSSEFQKPALVRRFVRECVFEPLARCGVQRVSGETSPSNLAMARLFTELKFHVTGQQFSDRWGPLVRYTKFLDPGCEAAFLKRFNGTTPRRA